MITSSLTLANQRALFAGVVLAIGGFDIASRAQTNSPAKTNSTSQPAPSAAQLKLAAIQRVNEFWKIERDQVREETKISLKSRMVGLDGTSSIEIDVICRVNESAPVPEDFTLHFISHSDDWRFLKYSEFIINYDGIKKDFGELKVDGEVLASARVLEQMMAHLDYDEFHQMSFARNVRLNLGTQMNDTISTESRIKWQVLCHYFDLIKSDQKAKSESQSTAGKTE